MKLKTDYSKLLMIVALIVLMLCGFLVKKKKATYREAMRLPFYNVQLESVEDGVYYGKSYTSYLRLQLNVTVENHKIVNIDVIENKGIDGIEARPIIEKMINENKIAVTAIEGAERGSLQYISCVDSALYNGK